MSLSLFPSTIANKSFVNIPKYGTPNSIRRWRDTITGTWIMLLLKMPSQVREVLVCVAQIYYELDVLSQILGDSGEGVLKSVEGGRSDSQLNGKTTIDIIVLNKALKKY